MKADNMPKYIFLQEYIKGEIASGRMKRGDYIPSENELAAQFGLSRHTVRQAIAGLTNMGILVPHKGKGTMIAPPTGGMVGVIITYINNYIFPAIISGINSTLLAAGYSMLLLSSNNRFDKEEQCIEMLSGKPLHGLIVEPTQSALPNPNIGYYRSRLEANFPMVFINGFYKDLDTSYVVEDDKEGGYIATWHLIEKGHKNIGAIFKVDDQQGHSRFQGFSDACRKGGMKVKSENIIWYTTRDAKMVLADESFRALQSCSAVVCYNDQVALKLAEYLKRQGIHVPADIALVGFDNSELATATELKLTTVQHPGELTGIRAAEILLGGTKNVKEMMKPSLIVRHST